MSAPRQLRTSRQPLGVTESGSVGFTTDALRLRAPMLLRSSKVGLVALTGLAACMTVLVVAAPGSSLLLPESIRAIPPTGTVHQLAGPFVGAALNIRSGGLVAAMLAMFICYVVAVWSADRVSARAVLLCIVFINC